MASELWLGRIAGGTIIRVVGRGTMHESLAFRAVVESNLDGGTVIFDAAQCDYLDSTFLGSLIAIKKACERSAERQFLIGASKSARIKLFSTSSLHEYFSFVETCPETIDGFERIDIEKLDPLALGRHAMRCHQHLAERGGPEAAAFKSVADCLRKEMGEASAD